MCVHCYFFFLNVGSTPIYMERNSVYDCLQFCCHLGHHSPSLRVDLACAVLVCPVARLLVSVIWNTHTGVNACSCTLGLYRVGQGVEWG